MLIMLLNVTMKFPFISPRRNRERQDRENRPRTVQISVPSELVMDLLTKGAILQVQIGPVPLRPNLTRPEDQNQPIQGQKQRLLISGLMQMNIPGLILLEGQILTHPGLKDLKAGARLTDQ